MSRWRSNIALMDVGTLIGVLLSKVRQDWGSAAGIMNAIVLQVN
jgi:hypothetical protein